MLYMDESLQGTLRESIGKVEARRDELRRHLDQADRTLEELRKLLSSITEGDSGSPSKASVSRVQWYGGAAPPSNGSPLADSLHGGTSRRQVILHKIIPQFGDDVFSPRDVRVKYLEMYPDRSSKSLSPTISSLLREMAERNEIERVGRGDSPTDPWMYRATNKDEETLLR